MEVVSMTKKIEIVPGKLVAHQAVIGIVVASLFLLFGLVLAVVVLLETSWSSEPGLVVALCAFWLVWIAACVSLIIFFRRLLKVSRDSGMDALGGLRIENDGPTGNMPKTGNIEARLRNLDKLRQEGLITEEEFFSKRSKIVDEL
jgi:hypothetical protein